MAWIAGGLVLLVILTGVWLVSQREAASPELQPHEISIAAAYDKFQNGAFLLDVREPSEWEDYHVEGTTLIPLGQLQSRLGELPRDREIVVVCRSGNRSQEGRDILRAAGFEQVTSMSGGLRDWSAAGYPLVGNRP